MRFGVILRLLVVVVVVVVVVVKIEWVMGGGRSSMVWYRHGSVD